MNELFIYSPFSSPRLVYVLEWLIKEQLSLGYVLVHDEQEIHGAPFVIAYGKPFLNALSIPACGLLSEADIKEQNIETGSWYSMPTLFKTDDADYTLPFDLFSAIFYLLSRYEEYLPFTPDKYNRYPATESILSKNGWLQSPVMDEWVHELRSLLQKQFNTPVNTPEFSYQPTYDIDIAYSYRHKGLLRTIGAIGKDLIASNTKQLKERTDVLLNKKEDPYDSFGWLLKLHAAHSIQPLYFILAARETTPYDKNIPPDKPVMKSLIKRLLGEGPIGIHPSYYSDKKEVLIKEKKTLENIISKPIKISRQHYIKINLPDTYRLLAEQHIEEDYSMGYGTHLGFRAGTGNSFSWYDLPKETVTALRIYPFCFMDTTALYEEKLSTSASFKQLCAMAKKLQNSHSRLITIFHNFSLGTSPEWDGWRGAYEQFITGLKQL